MNEREDRRRHRRRRFRRRAAAQRMKIQPGARFMYLNGNKVLISN